MTEFEQVLQECLHDMEQGLSSVDECLRRHPEQAAELEPVLLTSAYLARGRDARLSDAFKKRVRTRLVEGMEARPRRVAPAAFSFARLAAGLMAVLLVLVAAGTVYAQSALPGTAFYSWKLASENAWRSVSPDPIGADLLIASRRANELIAVRDNPALSAQTVSAYLDAVARLKSEMDPANARRILPVLYAQAQEFNQTGVVVPQINKEVPPLLEEITQPPQIPTPTETATPFPTLETPQVGPTDLPPIVPTVQVPQIRSTLPKLAPTIEIPPLP